MGKQRDSVGIGGLFRLGVVRWWVRSATGLKMFSRVELLSDFEG